MKKEINVKKIERKYKYVLKNIIRKIEDDDPDYKLVIETYYDYGDTHCTCGKQIKQVSIIKNTNNNTSYKIGCVCIESMIEVIDLLDISDDFKKIISILSKHYKERIKCDACNKMIIRKNYHTHINSKKHQENEIMHLRGDRYINVAYKNKEIAKKAGARWDPDERSWYIPQKISTEDYDRMYEFYYKNPSLV